MNLNRIRGEVLPSLSAPVRLGDVHDGDDNVAKSGLSAAARRGKTKQMRLI